MKKETRESLGHETGIIRKAYDLGPEWQDVVGERPLKAAVWYSFGFADLTVAHLKFTDGRHEVGAGEAMRSYTRIYRGTNGRKAAAAFRKYIRRFGGIPK